MRASDLSSYNLPTNSELLLNNSRTGADPLYRQNAIFKKLFTFCRSVVRR